MDNDVDCWTTPLFVYNLLFALIASFVRCNKCRWYDFCSNEQICNICLSCTCTIPLLLKNALFCIDVVACDYFITVVPVCYWGESEQALN